MFGKFFLPGPTEVRPEILAAQPRPMIGHRGKAMEELIASLEPALQRVFRTQRPVYISTSSATGFMEGAVRNGARRQVLSLVNGAFSERFHRIAARAASTPTSSRCRWGQGALAGSARRMRCGARTTTPSPSCTRRRPPAC